MCMPPVEYDTRILDTLRFIIVIYFIDIEPENVAQH